MDHNTTSNKGQGKNLQYIVGQYGPLRLPNRYVITLLVSHSEYPRDKPFLLTPVLARPIQPKRLVRPGQLAGNSERACGI